MAEDSDSNNDDADIELQMYHTDPGMFNSNDSANIDHYSYQHTRVFVQRLYSSYSAVNVNKSGQV